MGMGKRIEMNYVRILALLILFAFTFSTLCADEELIVRRVFAHLLLKDYRGAYQEVQQGMIAYPDSRKLHAYKIKVLAAIGDDQGLLHAWEQYAKINPEACKDRLALEALAWGYIEKASHSQSPLARVMAMIAACLSNSARGVAKLEESMEDTNAIIRALAVKFSGKMQDERLRDRVKKMYRTETAWNVRLELVGAVGALKIDEMREDLENLLSDRQASAELKAAALSSLVELMETADRPKVEKLSRSSRSGLRLLACEVVAEFDLVENIDLLAALASDPLPDVRKAALQALGMLKRSCCDPEKMRQIAESKLKDSDPYVAITAAWLLTIYNPENGQLAFKNWLKHPKKDVRLFAAAALGATGKYGLPLIKQTFYQTDDEYTRINLAMQLISQRCETEAACSAIYQALTQNRERWMWKEEGLYRYVALSNLKLKDEVPQYPEASNQLVRLELLQILAFMHYPGAQQAIRHFLQEKTFGITSVTISLMLTEGDEEALNLIRSLTADTDPEVRAQAILLLAIWGQDEGVIKQLEDSYSTADRETKEKILEGLGKIGADSSIPFLLSKLKEPSQALRIFIASSLLQCLYH